MSENALALLEEKNAAQYFVANGLDPIIEKIRAEVTTIVTDISTKKGRDEIASLAYKVAKSKTAIDELGKKLVSGIKEQAKAIDAERGRAWDAIEAIQKEVRKPLTEWEEAEKARIAGHEADLSDMELSLTFPSEPTAAEIQDRLDSLDKRWHNKDWQEFAGRAAASKQQVQTVLVLKLAAATKREAERAELERLRQEEAERRQREHEEKLKAEAAAKARTEAEAQARREADALAAKVKAEAEQAERDRLAIERERVAAEGRAAKAEADRIAAEEKAKADALAAAAKAERDAEAAVQRERERAEAAKKAEAEAAAKREANKKHRAKIEGEALAGLIAAGIAEEIGRMVIGAIAKGEVPHVTIGY